MSGVDNMNYMYSLNANNGELKLYVNFDVKTDPSIDQVLTQIRKSQADSKLPAEVNNYGVTVKKSNSSLLMMVSLYSPKGTYDATFLANYAYINLNDQITRVRGYCQCHRFGAGQYAMRFWVKPDQLAKLSITDSGDHKRDPTAEHSEPRGPDRRRAGAARPGVYLCHQGAGTVGDGGAVLERSCSAPTRTGRSCGSWTWPG